MDALYDALHARLSASLQTLPDKPRENPETALRALWFAAAGEPRSVVAAAQGALPPLADDGARQSLARMVERRLAGEPLAYLTGRGHFMGLELLAGPDALIPRVETELLARACVELLRPATARHPARVVDVCTGSGNLAFAIARQVPDAEVFGADISAEALALAARNREHLDLPRVELRCGDLLSPFGAGFDGTVDLVACAPPYILSAKVEQMAPEISAHEPRLAFDGGPLGVGVLLRLLEESPRLLRAGGWLAFEAGLGQGPAMRRRLERDSHYDEVRTLADDRGDVRAILARRA
ncbi:MAG: peptide chain release factor N(5)-glutamine methyltransferase [Frateuria sp.]|uniref:N5-glutamine methyltransferase family protein n=1 Tax=Frateuria sp. TaxID=2211372 RepID=UPI001857C9B2|nr:HemK family protein methyltransferase [Frateuria sp.]NUO71611.1 peptide chain release factor N(5)-glutamine methyltransferase [Frateuria sp.]NUR23919.1 peptide chain release factor N(5)-glutamine methyltransferase [Frateuria sp.]